MKINRTVFVPRLVEIYDKIIELESVNEHMSRTSSKKYINLCKEAEKIITREYSDKWSAKGLIKERKILEDDLASKGYISAMKCNLGTRIEIHIVCRQFNLFGVKTGWVIHCTINGNSNKKSHYVSDNNTLCGYTVSYESQPDFVAGSISPYCISCRNLLSLQMIEIHLERHPAIPKNREQEISDHGLTIRRKDGYFSLIDETIRRTKCMSNQEVLKIKDVGYGKTTLKKWNEVLEVKTTNAGVRTK